MREPNTSNRSAITRLGFLALAANAILWSAPCLSEESLPWESTEKRFILPVEIDSDSGAANGDAIITRLLPVHSIPLQGDWKLFNTGIVVIANAPGGVPGSPGNPSPVSGGHATGLGDFTDALLFTRTRPNGLIWGVGPIMSIPIASDEQLGSGKWSAGPAVRLAYNSEEWHIGMLAGNLTSFAGDSDRADVNQLLIRGLVRHEFENNWFFKYSPIITANWNADSGQRWLVPLGGGAGKQFELLSTPVNMAVEAYANVIKPDGAPDWVLRFAFTLPLTASSSE